MAGLLDAKKTNPAGQAPAGQAPAGQSPAGQAPGAVSEEEQAQYDEFVTNGMKLMNDEKGIDKILQAIGGDNSPVEGLANVVAGIVMRVEDSANKGSREINGDVLIHGGTELLEQAADLAEQAGIHTFTDDELESALYMALDLYREARQGQGKIQKDQFGQDLQELLAAEEDGRLAKEMPELVELSQRTPPEGGPQGPQGPQQPQPGPQGPPQRGLMG